MLKKSGNCDKPVMGLVECEEAAISLGLSPDWGTLGKVLFTEKYDTSTHEAKTRPYGCTVVANSLVDLYTLMMDSLNKSIAFVLILLVGSE